MKGSLLCCFVQLHLFTVIRECYDQSLLTTDSISNLMMTWCVLAGFLHCVRATVRVIHWTCVTAMMESRQVLTLCNFLWLCARVGWEWCHSSLMLMSLFFLFPEKTAVQSPGCEWAPSSEAADIVFCISVSRWNHVHSICCLISAASVAVNLFILNTFLKKLYN